MDRVRTALGVAALVTVAACNGGDVTGARVMESRTEATPTDTLGKGGGWSGSGYLRADGAPQGGGGWSGSGY